MTTLRLAAPIWFVVCGACGASPPAASSGTAAGTNPQASKEEALRSATELLAAANIEQAIPMRLEEVARAVAAGADETVLIDLLERILGDCLAADEACGESLAPGMRDFDGPARILLGLLGEIGGGQSMPLLVRLDTRGLYPAGMALDRLLQRRWAEKRESPACAPPTAEEIGAARAGLDDFVVLRFRDGEFSAEAPTAAERDDLAYFLAAVSEAGPEVGTALEGGGGSWTNPGSPNPELQQRRDELDLAKRNGDITAMFDSGMAYLATLGYPEPLRTEEEDQYAWGGAVYSYVMRDVALAAEALDRLDVAAELYRRADPGGGACGTSVSYRWQQQIEGVIRAEEGRGRGRAVVAERLLAVDGAPIEDEQRPEPTYGPTELTASGYDVARLYRGALVTIHRDIPRDDLVRVLSDVPSPLGDAARERLEARGTEAWERRVLAIEGLADTAQRNALPVLLELARNAPDPMRLRALRALAALAERPLNDPCLPLVGLGGSGAGEWSREIRMLGRFCDTVLKTVEAAELAGQLAPLAADPDPDLRAAAVVTIGAIGSPSSLALLRSLVEDPYEVPGATVCESSSEGEEEQCRPSRPVADAARDAIASIEELEQYWSQQAAEAAANPDTPPP